MGESQIEQVTAGALVTRLLKNGLTEEMASRAAFGAEDRYTCVMVDALRRELAKAKTERQLEHSSLLDVVPVHSIFVATRRTGWWKRHLKRQKIKNISVPIPNVSDDEINRRVALPIPQKLFFNHFTSQDDYDAFMTVNGQGNHWTVTDEAERAKIGWEFSATGYWFWAEVSENCPRLKTPWSILSTTIRRLLSFEEYVIVWHATKAERNIILDKPTWSWLRTRYNGSGALCAYECDGEVSVDRHVAESLSEAFDDCGGRSSEVLN